MQQDDQHAGHRQQNARGLRQRQPHPEQHQRPHRDHQRPGRLQQQRVQRLGMLERPVLQGVERADAGDREHDHDAEAAADRGPVADQVLPGKGQDDQERERPAQEGKRHRRDMAGGQPPDDGVAGPAQRGDAEQQIRLVGEPVAAIGRVRWVRQPTFCDKGPVHGAAARPATARRAGMWPGPRHRHGFGPLINGAGCIATMQPPVLPCCLGLPGGGRICNLRTIDVVRSNLGLLSGGAWIKGFRAISSIFGVNRPSN